MVRYRRKSSSERPNIRAPEKQGESGAARGRMVKGGTAVSSVASRDLRQVDDVNS